MSCTASPSLEGPCFMTCWSPRTRSRRWRVLIRGAIDAAPRGSSVVVAVCAWIRALILAAYAILTGIQRMMGLAACPMGNKTTRPVSKPSTLPLSFVYGECVSHHNYARLAGIRRGGVVFYS